MVAKGTQPSTQADRDYKPRYGLRGKLRASFVYFFRIEVSISSPFQPTFKTHQEHT